MSESKATTISAILNRDPPPLVRFAPEVPAEWEREAAEFRESRKPYLLYR